MSIAKVYRTRLIPTIFVTTSASSACLHHQRRKDTESRCQALTKRYLSWYLLRSTITKVYHLELFHGNLSKIPSGHAFVKARRYHRPPLQGAPSRKAPTRFAAHFRRSHLQSSCSKTMQRKIRSRVRLISIQIVRQSEMHVR